MADRCFVLGAKSYDFLKDDGQRLQGLHVHYVDFSFQDDTETSKGVLPMKIPAVSSVMSKITKVPAFYDLDFRQRPDGKGRPVLTLTGAVLSDDQPDFELI